MQKWKVKDYDKIEDHLKVAHYDKYGNRTGHSIEKHWESVTDRFEPCFDVENKTESFKCKNALKNIIFIICILTVSIIFTWVAFKVFPTTLEAQKVVTAFAGIFGIISGSIGLFKLLA
jgi:hypothetical protein